jgi:hypothetical protein
MLSQEEKAQIYRQAYVPEHLPEYVTAISGAEPHLVEDHLCFTRRNHLIFVGYPLCHHRADTPGAYRFACERFRPATVAILAPQIFWLPEADCRKQPSDSYYRLALPLHSLNPEAAYMVRRAAKELAVGRGKFRREHQNLIKAFLKRPDLSPAQIHLFKQMPQYLKRSATACLLEARKEGLLAAFTVVDTGSAESGFYLFNFRSDTINVPGASDLLFHEMVKLALSAEKTALNLGLGIHPGLRRFKEKWGGVPFLSYESALVDRGPLDIGSLANKL